MRLMKSMYQARVVRSLLTGGVLTGLVVCISPAAQAADRDVTMAVEQARAKLQGGQPDEAMAILLELFSANDAITMSQRQTLAPEAVELLAQAQAQLAAAGRPEQAVQAADAAWVLAGRRPHPQYATTLAGLAEQTEKTTRDQSLYFARRALLVDPNNAAAKGIDHRLSTNRYKWPGLGILIGGAVVAAAGLGTAVYGYSKVGSYSSVSANKPFVAGISVAVVGGLITGTGGILLGIGSPVDTPVSPPYLPALPE